MKACAFCGQPRCRELVHFGDQPVCHHFVDGGAPEGFHPLILGLCEACGLVQLMVTTPSEQLVPRFDWISYNEPEAHLDAMVETLCGLPGISKEAVIGGVSYKEDSTLRRFRDRGYAHTWRVDPAADLAVPDPKAGIESIQMRFQPPLARQLQAKYGAPDILIARHILEHTYDTLGFLATLRQLVKPTGYVVFEVPDCARGFDLLDYTTLWEDHSLYLVEATLLMVLRGGGFSLARFERYVAPYENCLVAIVKPETSTEPVALPEAELQQELERAQGFGTGFAGRRHALRQLLTEWRKRGPTAMFGAGHQSAMFLNLLGVADLIEFVVDDHPRKCGLRMPGSRLPIVGSDSLLKKGVKLCLSSLSAESEKKVVQKNRDFVEQGGTFASIFPVQRDAMLNFVAGPNT